MGRKGRDVFDFDAPRFTDFARPRYRGTKRLLDQLVLKQRPEGDPETWPSGAGDASSDTSSDGWFDRVHQSHEPSSPMSPPGALISPERPSRPASSRPSTLQRAHQTPSRLMDACPTSYISPNISLRKPLPTGLRAKPLRIIPSQQGRDFSMSSAMLSRSSMHSSLSSAFAAHPSSALANASEIISDARSDHGMDFEYQRDLYEYQALTPRLVASPISKFFVAMQKPDEEEEGSSDAGETGYASETGYAGERGYAGEMSYVEAAAHVKAAAYAGRGLVQSWAEHSGADSDADSGADRDADRDMEMRPPPSSVLLSDDNWTTLGSSLPSLEAWISTSNLESPPHISLPPDQPELDTAPGLNGGLRKFGMAARATRVQVAADAPLTSINPSPTLKRVKTEATRTEAPPVRSTSSKAVKIEDLKKILAEHNQRLRPRRRL